MHKPGQFEQQLADFLEASPKLARYLARYQVRIRAWACDGLTIQGQPLEAVPDKGLGYGGRKAAVTFGRGEHRLWMPRISTSAQ